MVLFIPTLEADAVNRSNGGTCQAALFHLAAIMGALQEIAPY
jgi:hypothetical protein